MLLLKDGDFSAMIAPKEVGLYLAKKHNVSVKILFESNESSPVGIAVKKGNSEILKFINNSLQKLIQENQINKLYKNWFN